MKLGIIAPPVEESFKSAQQRGLDFLEFTINIEYNTDEFFASVPSLREWSKKYNVGVGSIGRWGTDKIDSKGNIIKEELEISYKLIEAASELGCDNFVTGCNYNENMSYFDNCKAAIEFLSLLLEKGSEKGVKISTYNCRWNNFIVENMSWTIVHGHLKDLGIKFDPSHSRYYGGDYLKEAMEWGDRFYHVHLKGSLVLNGDRFDDPPAGMDETNWGAFISVLYAKKYDRCLSIEPHSSTWAGELGEKGVDFTIKYFRNLIFR